MLTFERLRRVKIESVLHVPRWVWVEELDDGKLYVFSYGSVKIYDAISNLKPLNSLLRIAQSPEDNQLEAFVDFVRQYGPLTYSFTDYRDINSYAFAIGPLGWDVVFSQVLPRNIINCFLDQFKTRRSVCLLLLAEEQLKERITNRVVQSREFLAKLHSNQTFEEIAEILRHTNYSDLDKFPVVVAGEPLENIISEAKLVLLHLKEFIEKNRNPVVLDEFAREASEGSRFKFFIDDDLKLVIPTLLSAICFRIMYEQISRGLHLVCCGYCGKIFVPARKDQKFCSDACRFSSFQSKRRGG